MTECPICDAIREENVCRLLKSIRPELSLEACNSLISSLDSLSVEDVARGLGVTPSDLLKALNEAERLLVSGRESLLEELCSRIGPSCHETLERARRGELGFDEAFRLIEREGRARGLTDEDIDRLIEKHLGVSPSWLRRGGSQSSSTQLRSSSSRS
jgi:hypothetical protein